MGASQSFTSIFVLCRPVLISLARMSMNSLRRIEPRVVRRAPALVLRTGDIRLQFSRQDYRREQSRQGPSIFISFAFSPASRPFSRLRSYTPFSHHIFTFCPPYRNTPVKFQPPKPNNSPPVKIASSSKPPQRPPSASVMPSGTS